MNVKEQYIIRLAINEIKHQTKQAVSNFRRTNMERYNQQCQINAGINRMRKILENLLTVEKIISKTTINQTTH